VSQSFAFRCADGGGIAIHLSSPAKFWTGLLQALERPDLREDPRFAQRMDRVHHHEALRAVLAPEFAQRTRAEWVRRLSAADVPHAPILGLDEALEDPQLKHLAMDRTLTHPTEGPVRTLRTPLWFDGQRDDADMQPPPALDEHGAQIRAELASRTRNPPESP
jgi:crotonobetainyl-CoA:carnitine CoA-transferase CaiB-like acyl-CoA transferase